jgi:hypothetical protein
MVCYVYRGSYHGARNDEVIHLSLSLGDYGTLARIFQKDTQLVEKAVPDPLVKQELLGDLHRIRRLIEQGER